MHHQSKSDFKFFNEEFVKGFTNKRAHRLGDGSISFVVLQLGYGYLK
jgi:hypothetical protein